MKRLALAFAVATLTTGCIYLTPATGIRLGAHDKEFEQAPGQGAAGVSAGKVNLYRSGDFTVIYPDIWTPLGDIDQISRDASLVKRVGIGQVAQNGDAEGLQVTTLLTAIDPDPSKNLQGLAALVTKLLQSGLKADSKVLATENRNMDSELGIRVELAGTGLDQLDTASGKVIAGTGQHFLVQCAWHQGHGYIAVISTTESRWAPLKDLFVGLLDQFKFTGATLALCTPVPSGSPVPGPSASASVAPSPKASARASQDPGATGAAQDGVASGPLNLVVCFSTPKPSASPMGVVGPILDGQGTAAATSPPRASASPSANPASSASPAR